MDFNQSAFAFNLSGGEKVASSPGGWAAVRGAGGVFSTADSALRRAPEALVHKLRCLSSSRQTEAKFETG